MSSGLLRSEGLRLSLVLLVVPLVVTWPLVLRFDEALLTHRTGEGAAHVWALWAALGAGSPLLFHTDTVSWPDGVDVLLIDPLNLPWVALGAPLGPAAAYNAIFLGGTLLMGLAGAALAREAGGRPWLGAVAAMACPAFLAGTIRGATEQLAVAWVGLALAAMVAAARRGGAARIVLAGLLTGACVWGGPYNGLWVALLGLALFVATALGQPRLALSRVVPVGLVGALAAMPVALAILRSFSVMNDPRFADPTRAQAPLRLLEARGGNVGYADVLDPWLPAPFTGPFSELSQTTYLGCLALALAALAVARERRLWPWLAGALALSCLALGPRLYLGGHLVVVGGLAFPLPAELLGRLPGLGSITHWYRVAPVAGLLVAALVSRWGSSRLAPLVALGLLADLALLAPLPFPHAATLPPDPALITALPQHGAVLELPASTQSLQSESMWRNAGALQQVGHGQPSSSTVMLLPEPASLAPFDAALRRLAQEGVLDPELGPALHAMGFRSLLLRRGWPARGARPANPGLWSCLGTPTTASADAWAWDLGPILEGGGCPAR